MRIAVILLVATAAVAQAPTTFREGFLAFENGDYAAAERLMRETVKVNPKESEGTVRISGSWFETYVPYYFLGRALAKQKKCAEAIAAFEESERQGITPAIPDFARHLRTRGGCKPQPKAETQPKVLGEVTVPFGGEEVVASPPAPPPQKKEQSRTRLAPALAAYFAGRYDETVRLLQNAAFKDPAAQAEALLFRAAARDALYRIGGAKDDALARQVQNDLREYRRLRPNGRPNPRVFPPRFVAMAERGAGF